MVQVIKYEPTEAQLKKFGVVRKYRGKRFIVEVFKDGQPERELDVPLEVIKPYLIGEGSTRAVLKDMLQNGFRILVHIQKFSLRYASVSK